jgi:hypothetical protein
MKAFYWQLGLHIQPDTEEESKALALVFNSITKSTLAEARAEDTDPSSPGNTLNQN